MQIEIKVPAGQAMIYLAAAKALMLKRAAELATCTKCDQSLKERHEKGAAFFEDLINQLRGDNS